MTKRILTLRIVSQNLAITSSSSNVKTVGIYTFFEASRIRCRKTIFDVTKVTYNMYSWAISCMSREMTEMDCRNSVECQKSKLGDIYGILGIV